MWFDAPWLELVGKAPDVTKDTDYPLILTAYDKDFNYVQVDFIVTVYPNKICEVDPAIVEVTCYRG